MLDVKNDVLFEGALQPSWIGEGAEMDLEV